MITRHLQNGWEEWHRSLLVKVFLAILILPVFFFSNMCAPKSAAARLSDKNLLIIACDVVRRRETMEVEF
jgi:hypothetical protein